MNDRDDSHKLVISLVERFRANHDEYTRANSKYNETQLRNDFINPFLKALGWDIFNEKFAPQHLREVVQEDTLEIDDDSGYLWKKPDYALRVGGERKFFIETKKPSVRIDSAKTSAFQLRRYGWNAQMVISVLTNFDKLVIYDCRPRPKTDDDVRLARIKIYSYTEYVTQFDQLYDQLSREAVYSGKFDEIFGLEERTGAEPFDQYFLQQIENWRERLAEDLSKQNRKLMQDELNFLVQRLINRIIFLRICEDRELEKYEGLKEAKTYANLKALFHKADNRYNSGLFDFVEDKLSLNVNVGSKVLMEIFKELYYPESPYAFSVIEANVLGEIYELFIAKEVHIGKDGSIEIVEKPEVLESKGVVTTPKYIVDAIIQRTMVPLCQDKSPDELSQLRVADIACGSGTFLLAAYEYLVNYHLEQYLDDGVAKHRDKVYEGTNGEWQLTLNEKQRVLLNNIYGVDNDIQAVEVTRFSLLIKVLENQSAAAVDAHLDKYKMRALPNLNENIQCGNSLVDSTYFEYDEDGLTSEKQLVKINPFDWDASFPGIMDDGFDVIIGNPPYIRIQNMVKYTPEEIGYYKSEVSPYTTAESDNFDKYALFIERALLLLKATGRLGYIVPHKFFTIKSGKSLRKLISSGKHLAEIVHFGVHQVFGKRTTTYTCILILRKKRSQHFTVEHVNDLSVWRYSKNGIIETHSADEIYEEPWVFVHPHAKSLFERLRVENTTTLNDLADIFVGVQTSADKIYIIQPMSETANLVRFTDINRTVQAVEKAILRPCLLDVEIKAFGKPLPNTYIIFPYKIINNKAELYSPNEMRTNFPRCWKYLNVHKKRLQQRNIQNYTPNTWHRYGRSQSLTKFDGKPKLIWPILSLEPRYAYDDQNIIITGGGNGPYYALRSKERSLLSIYYLQAILSHPVIEAMVRARASKFRGGYGSHGKQFIKDIPIRKIDLDNSSDERAYKNIEILVKQLIIATNSATKSTIPHKKSLFLRQRETLKKKIDRIIEKLYRIDRNDLKALEESIKS